MGTLIIEFPMPDGSVTKNGTKLTVDLGNGVRMLSHVPEWVLDIHHAKLQLIMDVDGTSPNANSEQTPIR